MINDVLELWLKIMPIGYLTLTANSSVWPLHKKIAHPNII